MLPGDAIDSENNRNHKRIQSNQSNSFQSISNPFATIMTRSRTSSPARPATRSSAVASRPQAAARPQPVAQPPAVVPPPAQAPSMGSSILGGLVQGMTFGAGSALGHRAVDSVLGPRQVEHVQTAAPVAASNDSSVSVQGQGQKKCFEQWNALNQCMKDNSGGVANCQFYFDMLNQCQKD